MAVPKAELERRISRFGQTCARAGMKVTHQRTEVFREVAGRDEHPDAETVYQRVRRRVTGISRDTVYRTLAMLESEGLIHRTGALSGPARYDANLERHHHFVCIACGKITDFRSKALDGLPIPRSVTALGRIGAVQVYVRGVCSACVSRETARRRRSPRG